MAADACPRRELAWRPLACLLGVALTVLSWLGAASAAAQDRRPRVGDVEAAYVVNFLRYTQWPAQRFSSAQSPIVVTVVGPPEVADRLRAIAAAAGPIDGRSVEVHNLTSARGSLATPLDSQRDREAAQLLRRSHLVFFHDAAAPLHPRVLADLWGAPVLTVGNSRGFAARGGMLGLVRNGDNIVFEANPGAIRQSGLVVSAKVLKLARVPR